MSHDHGKEHHDHDAQHELAHLKQDAYALGGVTVVATASEHLGRPAFKTFFSLGGEDAWWAVMTARRAWNNQEGGYGKKLAAGLKASKFSIATIAGTAVAAPFINEAIENTPSVPASALFSAAAVSISTVSMVEDAHNVQTSGQSFSQYDIMSRRFRKQGILATFAAGFVLNKYVGAGNPYALSFVGGLDCIWTSGRSFFYAKRQEQVE